MDSGVLKREYQPIQVIRNLDRVVISLELSNKTDGMYITHVVYSNKLKQNEIKGTRPDV